MQLYQNFPVMFGVIYVTRVTQVKERTKKPR